MNKILVGIIISILFISCDNTIERKILKMQDAHVCIPLDKMNKVCIGEAKECQATDLTYVCYVDSSLACRPCYIKHTIMWKRYLELEKTNKIKFLFIFEVPETDLDKIKKEIEQSVIRNNSYVDTKTVFRLSNKFLPEESVFHSFLLDKMNHIIMVGDPTYNESIYHLLEKILIDKGIINSN